MKYIKKYELYKGNFEEKSLLKPNYKIGDTVICRYKDSDHIRYGDKYIVDDIYFKNEYYFTKVKNVYDIYNPSKLANFYAGKFISEVEWNANKYNI